MNIKDDELFGTNPGVQGRKYGTMTRKYNFTENRSKTF